MPSQKFELSDISGQRYSSDTNLTMGQEKRNGCFISTTVAVVMAVLAVLLAVAVGLIVYFAVDGRDVVCNCDNASNEPSTAAITDKCKELAAEGHQEICNTCTMAYHNSTPTPEPTSTTSRPAKVKDVRLPRALNPEHYDVRIQPYMYDDQPEKFHFKGSVKAIVKCLSPTNNVTLHINVLQVDPSSIRFYAMDPGGSDPSYVNFDMDEDRQFIIINVNRNMAVGKMYAVEMDFTSPLKDDLKGLYYSSYTRDNQTIYLATTQFQPTDARKTFPCMDEPALKATFNITLVRPSYLISISNMPIIDSSETWPEGGIEYVADVYQKTPKMPTYLLAFIICDFEWTEGKTKNNITYRAIARPEAKESTRYALQAGIDILTYFEEYFEIPYPLPKQDMIAVPDFAAGAMENWGLITYRETAMLYTPGVSNERNKERVAVVVSHELAHQWFGDLVTPSWWDDLWLNEGFASFVEYLGVDHIHPEWKMFDGFAVGEIQDVFDFDGLISSHPVYVPVAHPDEINEIFDRISYSKGASIIRMMRHFLGYETFRKGLVRYLNEKKYGAAFHDDLWAALSEQSTEDNKPLDVKSIMDTWTLQMNYPVVFVSRDFNDVNVLNVRQERYLRDRSAKDPGVYESPFGYQWTIPLTFTSSQNPNFNDSNIDIHWMYHTESQKTFSIGQNNLPPVNEQNGWILANVQQNGYYRVNYQMGNWKALAKQLKENHTTIPVINRAQIINDAWNFAKSGDLQVEVALEVVEYLGEEMDYVPWSAADREFSFVRTMLSLTPAAGAFENFLSKTTSKAYKSFGLDNTDSEHTETYARVLIASLTCGTGNKNCIDETSRLYRQWMGEPDDNKIDPNLKSLVYCNSVRNGGWDEWKFALDMYLASSDAGEKSRLLSAMSCSRTPWILNDYLYMLLEDKSAIRKQDALSVISYISRNVIGRPLAWNFFRANYDKLREQFGSSFFSWTRVIGQVTSAFNTEFEMEEIKSFMESKADALGTGKRAFEQAIEKTQGNIRWMQTNYPTIRTWLEERGYFSDDGGRPTKVTDVRLPTALKPEHYDVWLQPYMYNGHPESFHFKGSVKAIVNCLSPTNNVTLHINVLQVDPSSIKFYAMDPGGSDPSYVNFDLDADRQFIIINVNRNMAVGKTYAVEMNFTSPLKDDLKGLYYSTYTRDNQTIYLATTQFQPTDARKTFPCMDEPALKATFNITLVRRKTLLSISNMPIIDSSNSWREDGIEYVADVYQKTPKMPTYLLAFIICDFDWTENTTINNVKYRALARPEAKESTRYALQAGVDILTYFEEYFEIPFPLPKQDMIAIPDFAAGAMENWGLITYRETAMLYSPGVSNEGNKERVAVVVSHELAHQWFGDLVTPSWWDDLWLNEGFASFVEYLGVDHIHPEWKMFDGFAVGEIQDVFDFDGLISSHPVYVPVAHPDEINEIFDRISYSKGASIIRMMRHFLGYETFRKGLVRYLKSKAYDAAFHDDLWEALTEQSREDNKTVDVKSIMDTWTLQMNYPVVVVTRDVSDDNRLQVQVSQERYLRDRLAKDPGVYESPFGYQWTIPLTFTSSQNPNFNDSDTEIHWMYHNESQKTFLIGQNNLPPPNQKSEWILANVQQNGYYRVNYQIANWNALAKQLQENHTAIPVINRAQIINDAWNFAKSGHLQVEIALDVVEYLGEEMDYVPWKAADREFSFVRTMLSLTPAAGAFENFLSKTTSKAYKSFGLDNTGSEHTETYARVLIASLTCGTGNMNCIDQTSRLYRQWMDEPDDNKIDPNLKSLVYCNSVKNGDWEEWKFALDMYLASSDAGEQSRLLSAMSCSRKPWILNTYLYMILEKDSAIRKQDALSVISYISRNAVGRLLAWNFFRANYDKLKEQFGNSFFSWTRVIGQVTSAFNTEYEMEEIKSFMESKADALGTGKRAFEQAIEKTQVNIRWMQTNYPTIRAWLEERGYFSDDGGRPTKVTDVRLPTALKPEHYDVWLQPYMYNGQPKTFHFKGSVKAIVNCLSPTNNVTLHINVLQVDPSSIKFYAMDPGGSDPSYVNFDMDVDRQFIIINVNRNMAVGKTYAVEMNFTSPLKDDLTGLYYSSYTRGNETIYLATTQFQPTDARKTFPCMDEPALKATFNITLVRPKTLLSISNMPIIDNSTTWTEDGIEYVADVYQKTPKMPTYLLAFIICDFDWTENTTINNVKYRALARPEAKESTRYALQAGVDILTYFEEYFEIPFPLPKQDMIAIPDFAAGAMENWGLITYRETAMLYTPGVSNERNKDRVAFVVSHELAHQWFGDLVTPSWWDDLWLNEGFASFVEYLGVDHIHPEWKVFDDFAVREIQDVFNFDGLISSHPVYVPVAHPDEINEIFDGISYAKGASILRMMRHFLGYETFRKGLVEYLRSKAYDAAFHDDLWEALTNQSRKDSTNLEVKSIMDTWTLQMNYPVVTISRDSNEPGVLNVKQARYLIDRSAKDPGVYKSPFGYRWTIPLTFTSSRDPDFNDTSAQIHWMYQNETEKTFTIGQPNLPLLSEQDGWFVANLQQNGYYRVNYKAENWKALAKQLKQNHTVIPVINRAQIINDAWNLAKSGDLDLRIALEVIEYLGEEVDYIPWSSVDREFSYVRTMLSLTPYHGALENFLSNVTIKAYRKFGLNTTVSQHKETYALVLIAGWTCAMGNQDCVQRTSDLYGQWMAQPEKNQIDPNIKSLVYCNSVKNGGSKEWEFALDRYLATSDAGEKARLLSAMSCSRNPWLLNRFLYMLLEEKSPIRKQDAISVISYVSSNIVGRPLAWDFFRGRYDRLSQQFGSSAFTWSRVIGAITSAFNTEFKLEQVKSFMESKAGVLGTGKRAFEQAIEKIQGNIKWMKTNYPIISDWLHEGGYA